MDAARSHRQLPFALGASRGDDRAWYFGLALAADETIDAVIVRTTGLRGVAGATLTLGGLPCPLNSVVWDTEAVTDDLVRFTLTEKLLGRRDQVLVLCVETPAGEGEVEAWARAERVSVPTWTEIVGELNIKVGDTFSVSYKRKSDGLCSTALAVTQPQHVSIVRRLLHELEQPDTEMGSLWQNGQLVHCFSTLQTPASERYAISTDSHEYEILARAAKAVKDIPGLICELGVRTGGGTKVILDALIENGDLGRHHVCIDPYGDLPFAWQGEMIRPGYTNEMRQQALANLYEYVRELPVTLHFFALTDEDYINRFSSGLPVYATEGRKMLTEYALVHIDGPHDTESVRSEAFFFARRMSLGGVIVFDDWKEYDHAPIDAYLRDPAGSLGIIFDRQFEIIEQGEAKIVYRRIR